MHLLWMPLIDLLQGTMKRHLAKLGFTNVHNKNHDFYDVHPLPEHLSIVRSLIL